MARLLRKELADALYHVTLCGDGQDDLNKWVIHGYCLTLNHFLILIETPDSNLAEGMHRSMGRSLNLELKVLKNNLIVEK